MATGMVGVCGLVTKDEAPNSPRLMENANTPATIIGLIMRGRVIFFQTVSGEAPKTVAASLNVTGICLNVGNMHRITKGSATSAWAMGTRMSESLRLRGGLFRVII